MGKGDKKTPKGKRYAGSYGNLRPHSEAVRGKPAAAKAAVKPAAKRAPAAKKTVRKKGG